MSGGAFDYAYGHVGMFADSLTNKLDANEQLPRDMQLPAPVVAKLREIAADAQRMAALMKEAEWLYSDDISEYTFMHRVAAIEGDGP